MKKIIYLLSIVGYFAILNAQTGNVGINTQTPTNTLTVNGNQSIGAGYTGIAAPTNGMIIQGRTAIGTSTPFFGSLLELNSTGKGLRLPQVFLSGTLFWAPLDGTFNSPAAHGMTVYNTNPDLTSGSTAYPAKGVGEYYWDGTGWVSKNSTIGAQNAEAYFSVTRTTYQAIPDGVSTGTWTKLDFTTKTFGKTANDFDLATDSFTISPNGVGLYQINASYITELLPSTSQSGRIGIFVNGTLKRTLAAGSTAGTPIEAEGTAAIYFSPGDIVDFRYIGIANQTVMPTIDFYQISR
ncbi:hypothetical protein [Chryseobacterium sp. Leaf405]|uniref:hypothetical protein n=1 Tax=Chryseobacterium sp. Leaf405 TaxID=1736367 RepID=UPI00103C5B83|nr:hypothetical protein [Chryseobacterium sp. Leaf405]